MACDPLLRRTPRRLDDARPRRGCTRPGACGDARSRARHPHPGPARLASRPRADNGVELWPGSTRKLLTSDYEELALRIDPETLEPDRRRARAERHLRGAAGKDFYRQIMQELARFGRLSPRASGTARGRGKARLYVFTYDWRQDNVRTVQKLDELIEQIRRDYDDPTLRVDVIAHSMGGLVVQYFERYGTADVLGGNSFQVTGLGLAKLAAHRAARHAQPGHGDRGPQVPERLHRVGFSGLPTEGVATMPSTFQLFPHPLVDWVVNINGQPLNFDIFDVEFWRRYEWSIFDHRIQRRMDRHRDIWPQQDVFERWFRSGSTAAAASPGR